jgi:zinc protease
MLNRTIQPSITQPIDFDLQLKPYQNFVLDNGVQVYAIEAGEQEVLQLELVFDAGIWYEDKKVVAAATNFLLKNGTTSKTAFEINEHFDFYGAYLNRSCYSETATITLHTLSKNLSVLTPVITEILTEALFPENELNIFKQNQKQKLEVNLKKCDFIANRIIDECLYGIHHPYGSYNSTKDYDEVDLQSIKEFYITYYKQGTCKIFVAGKLPSNIEAILNKAFGALPLKAATEQKKEIKSVQATTKKYSIINDENGVQASVRIARNFPNKHHPDFQKVLVLNNIFGGFFGSRLMSNIREDKGYTYGIHSYLQNHIVESAWMISTECGRDVVDATLEEVYKEMMILQNNLIDKEELQLVKNYMIGTLLGDLDGPFQILARWKSYILNGFTEAYFNNAIHTIKTVTAEELQMLAKKYLNPSEFYELKVV